MSTKTTFKRIALVAVAALGFGMVSTVTASATVTTATYSSVVTNTTTTGATTAPISTGTALTANLVLTTNAAAVVGDTASVSYYILAGNKDITSTCTFTAGSATGITTTVAAAATGGLTLVATTTATHTAAVIATVSCPTVIAGTYTIVPQAGSLWVDVNATETTVTKYVAGLNVVQGLTRNTTAGTAAVGGNAQITFYPTYHIAATTYTISSTGVGKIAAAAEDGSTAAVLSYTNNVEPSAGVKFLTDTLNAQASTDSATLTLSSDVAGVQTITVSVIDATTGVSTAIKTATITWGSVDAISAGYTAAASYIGNGTTWPTSTSYLTYVGSYPKANAALAAGTGATIGINVRDASNVAMTGQALTATVSGVGLITLTAGSSPSGVTGTVRTQSLTATEMAGYSTASVGISGDGTAGTATVTVSSGTTTLFTKTLVFYGTVSKLVATQNLSIANKSGATLGTAVAAPAGTTVATTPAVIIVATDANGNAVTGLTITAKSADASVIASGTVIESDGTGAGDAYAGAGSYNASVTSAAAGTSGAKTTVVFRTLLSDGVTYISTDPVSFSLGGSVSTGSFTMALDKTSYAVGEAATLTVSGKDSAGNPIYDQDKNIWGGLGTAPVWSKSVVGLTPSDAATAMFVGGKKVYKGYAPSLEGSFSVAGVLDATTVLSGAALSASASVEGSTATVTAQAAADAAAEATDAANAATDAANAAAEAADAATAAAQDAADAVAALSAQVTTMMNAMKAQLTSLTNLVIKIQKKVKA